MSKYGEENNEFFIEFDLNARVIRVSKSLMKLTGISKNELLGMYLSDFFMEMSKNRNEYSKFLNDLRNGQRREESLWLKVGKDILNLHGSFLPLQKDDVVEKIICYAVYRNNPGNNEKDTNSFISFKGERNDGSVGA